LKALQGNQDYERLRTLPKPDYLGHVAASRQPQVAPR
jgi:hypothetical protein